jgi:hypothetical protein
MELRYDDMIDTMNGIFYAALVSEGAGEIELGGRA